MYLRDRLKAAIATIEANWCAESRVALNIENYNLLIALRDAELAAYRQARVFEPSMEGYHAAMSVYAAAFGKPDGEASVVLPDGTSKQPWEL